MKTKRWRGVLTAAVLAATTAVGAVSMPAVQALPGLTQGTMDFVMAGADSVKSAGLECQGTNESAYAEWGAVTGAEGYNVYADGKQIDSMLIRQYADCFRADVVGLTAGSHTLKVIPIIGGKEDASKAGEATVTVAAHERTGFAFSGRDGSLGAYNADGTLKSDAVVLYVTDKTKDTVSMDVVTSSKGTTTPTTGLQNILTAFKKGFDSRPLCIRVVGTVTDPSTLDKGDLTIDGDSKWNAGITIEGIGEDATLSGFGLRLKNISNVEIRNIGIMLVDSSEGDNFTLQQSCDHVWIHHCDSFYGMPGSDADQAKGDGAMDCKKSTYVTFSYNHFWDNGKCCLLGLSEGTTEDLYITYHHNWFDHSDSRHPRIRFYSAHVYNNYYDGNAKYGIGSTNGSSVFSENNYFRNCKYPMLTSMQGTDVDEAGGTFSGEDGGVIKAYGNIMEGQKAFVPYSEDNKNYDAYVASSRDEKVPSSVVPLQTSKLTSIDHTYNNFDTDASVMYEYRVDKAEDVPAVVQANAGRLNGGDFRFEFNDAADDADYAVNSSLMSQLQSYKSSVIAIGSGFTDSTDPKETTTPAQTTAPIVTTAKVTTEGTAVAQTTVATKAPDQPSDGDIFCAPNASGSGATEKDPASVTDAIAKLTPGHTIYLLGGTYALSEMIFIDENNSGTASAPKTIKAYNNADVVFDFSGQGEADGSKRGIVLDGDYWHFYGFEITKAADNGMLLSGNNNKIEMMIFNDNQDTGLQLSRYNTNAATLADWPSNNLILNCTSKNNCDNATMENADGFAAKLTCGEGNVFDGCMAYNNSDDGWDLFAKTATGPIGVVTIKNSAAFRNGYTEFGEGYGDCDGNGFKLGGSGVGSPHVLDNCLAFENLNCGFTDNNNPKLGSLKNCTAYNNGVGGNGKPNFSLYRCTDTVTKFTNIMSYNNTSKVSDLGAAGIKISNDKFVGEMANSVYYNSKYYKLTDATAMENGSKLGDVVTPTDSDFITLSVPKMGEDFHKLWRNVDGSINTDGYAETVGTYESMGYHFAKGTKPDDPIVTTAPTPGTTEAKTTASVATTTEPVGSETTASSDSQPITAGDYVHNFTENGLDSTFYTIVGSLSKDKGSVQYNGLNLTQCLKMESKTSITFTADDSGRITLVFAEPNATVKVDGTKYTASGDGIITVSLGAGDHTIAKADSANLFYMAFSYAGKVETTTVANTTEIPVDTTVAPVDTTTESSAADSTTTTTRETVVVIPGDALYGDVNTDGKVELVDAIILNKACAGQVTLTPEANANADCNADGVVDTSDSIALLRFLVHLLDALPSAE